MNNEMPMGCARCQPRLVPVRIPVMARVMGAETLLGNDVYNNASEDLGEIMLDMRTGKVGYAVLSYGGFLGMGEKFFAVPRGALKLDTKNKRFTLNVGKDQLKEAPGFDKDHWPDMVGEVKDVVSEVPA